MRIHDGLGQRLTTRDLVIVTVSIEVRGDEEHDDHEEQEPGKQRFIDRNEVLPGAFEDVHVRGSMISSQP
jgi:hypothetical protein